MLLFLFSGLAKKRSVMDENSSKYVDQLVMGKILEEKLTKVCHRPEGTLASFCEPLYGGFGAIAPRALFRSKNETRWVMESPAGAAEEENCIVPVYIYPARVQKKAVILVHGLFEENREMYQFLIGNLNRLGVTVYQTTLPYHYERKPVESAFSGEYFWSANINRCRRAFEQAVYELYQLHGSLQELISSPVPIIAFSMGAGVALSLLSLTEDIGQLFILNPVCSLSAVVWESPLCRTIKRDLEQCGFSNDDIVASYASFEPVSLLKRHSATSRVAIGYGVYDQITKPYQYRQLIDSCRIEKVYVYKSGHLNLLRVPKVAADIYNVICPGGNSSVMPA